MIKRSYTLIFSFIILCLAASHALAQEKRIVALKDGTKIVGEILSFENNVYTVRSSLGTLQIKDEDIVNISALALDVPASGLPQQDLSSGNPLDSQIHNMQQQLMTDQNFLSGAKEIAADPEIMQTLNQPEIMQAIVNRDVNALQSNPQFKNLLNNPKILELIQSASDKLEQPAVKP
ncbi:MAG: hypothetical protein WCX16_00170 [Candidatus Omnitrophota bacterium]